MKLIVGLGNPGKQYQNTRHNIGFLIVDELTKKLELSPKWNNKFNSLYFKEGKLVFLKPQTFMNLSGEAVAKAAKFFKVSPKDILIIHDDLDMDEGKIRFRAQGSAGGHNGLKSIIAKLATQEFPRIKVGIGHPGNKAKVTNHVLGKFEASPEIIDTATNKAIEWIGPSQQQTIRPKLSWTNKLWRRN